MVRVLSCYHFRGQKIGRCDEAAAVAVAGQSIVVGIEDSINVYIAGHSFQALDVIEPTLDSGTHVNNGLHEIGAPIIFGHADKSPLSPGEDKRIEMEQQGSGSCSSSVSSIESDTEIQLSHTFATVDLVRSLSYNRKGNYLLCLECRDGDGASRCSSIRVYFHWDKKGDCQSMRTRIAGVSPSSHDLEKPALTMVEIPLTSPAIAVASCTLTGHLASLSAESVVNVFSFRIKEVSGRGKIQYHDFDRLCAVEIPGFAPERLSFLGNFISCYGPGKIHVFRIYKSDKSWSPSVITSEKSGSAKSKSRISGGGLFGSKTASERELKSKSYMDHSNKITFDPSDDSVTIQLPSITRANRKRAGNTVVIEEYSGEILNNKSRIIFSTTVAGINVEDILRLSLPHTGSGSNVTSHERFSGTGLYPIRINEKLGAVACAVGLTKEAMMFHLPTKEKSHPVRIANYSFTAPLVTFTFDSLFFHALTESGLETYTSRSLYYALEDHEGFDHYRNACPLKAERPCLVGIRPFVRVRFMAANESLICLLACPTPIESGTSQQQASSPPLSPSSALLNDERLWTVYSLELPDADMLYEDTMRLAKSQEGQFDTYFTLLCELHLILRAYINAVPDDTPYYTPRYRSLCKSIGLEYLKASWLLASDSKECGNLGLISQVVSNQNAVGLSTANDELVDLAVTYLCMAKLDIQHIFSLENSMMTQEPQYIAGTVKLIDVLLSMYCAEETSDKHNFSPALSSSIVDFLSRHSPETLVDLVIKIPFLRENHSKRLLEIMQDFAEVRNYAGKEAVALILTFIAAGGVESNVRTQVQNILSKVKYHELESCLRLEFILDRNAKHSALTDVAICLTAVNSDLPTTILSDAVRSQEVSIAEVMLAFAKAVNLNSESQIQRSLAKALRTILEFYFSSKISNNNNNDSKDVSQNQGKLDKTSSNVIFNDDERHAVQALVRSYISDISLSPTNKLIKSATTESPLASENPLISDNVESQVEPESVENEHVKFSEDVPLFSETANGTEIMAKNQLFGKIPSFVNFLLGVDTPGGSITPANTTFSPTMFSNLENMESYIRLLSLLSSPCGKVEGVKDSVLTFVYNNSSSVKSTPLQLILLMFCEPVETAISILISRQPTTVLLYAKEMFQKSTSKWKILVTQLKKRINLNPNTTDSDMFSTIIENVYLHLANTLSLSELEEVLEKGSDDVAKFRSTCKRVELANSYASMVIQISTDYLQNKQ